MYQNGLVAVVRINGKTVEEKDGKVVIPFDSEYALLLKNRNDRKAVARIYIDGDEVTRKGKLIIDANSSIDIERYIDDMNKGNRFKFVPIADNRVGDKGDSEKGFIEVRFQLVKPVLNNFIVHEEHIYHKHHHYDDWDYLPYRGPFYINYPVFYGSLQCNATGKGMSASVGSNNFTLTSSLSSSPIINNATIQDNHLVETRGATIKGSDSTQRFSFAYVGELESTETVIRFQLIGTTNSDIIAKYNKLHCVSCNKTFGLNDVFCSVCGVKR